MNRTSSLLALRAGLGLVVLLTGFVLTVACGEPSVPSVERRTIEDSARGVRYVIPPHWRLFGDELRSQSGSTFTIEVFSLVGADRQFVNALPHSLVPLLERRTRNFFDILDAPAELPATVDGQPALEVSFPVRVREGDEPFRVIYRIVKVGDRLYALRLTHPPQTETVDADAALELIESLRFL